MFWYGIVAGLFLGASFGFILSGFFFARIQSTNENTPLSEQHNDLAVGKSSHLLEDLGLRRKDFHVYN